MLSKTKFFYKTQSSWLRQRQQIVSLLCSLLEVNPVDNGETNDPLGQLCTLLIDYTSMWHFAILIQLLENQPKNTISKNILEKIACSTDHLIQFNDRYTNNANMPSKSELVGITKRFSDRITLEDLVINAA